MSVHHVLGYQLVRNVLPLTDAEADALGGRAVARRGRRPKAAAESKPRERLPPVWALGLARPSGPGLVRVRTRWHTRHVLVGIQG